MIKLTREDIHLISRHSNWEKASVRKALEEQVYSHESEWQNFLRLFLAGLGTAFTVSGIVFFFAYNWADLHKFIKFALVELVIIATVAILFLPKINPISKNIILTGAAFLVGVLFAVLGQVYQTGANAYDFFLAWTVFILLWVLVADFAPLWLLFLVLVNTTLVFYDQQVARNWSGVWFFTLLFIINATFLVGAMAVPMYRKAITVPTWWTNIVALATVFCCTVGITIGIFEDAQSYPFISLLLITVQLFVLGIRYALHHRNGFYIAIIAFSLIFMVSALMVKIVGDSEILLIVSLFVIASTTLTVKFLIELQKKWTNEK